LGHAAAQHRTVSHVQGSKQGRHAVALVIRKPSKGGLIQIVQTVHPQGRTPVTWKLFNAD
jgi:hypothetical protein